MNRRRQFRHCSEIDAGLAVFVIDVDLNADIQRWHSLGALIAEPTRYLETIDAMRPVEGRGNVTRLVGLNGADEVPADIEIR